MMKSIQLLFLACFAILITANISSAVELKIAGRVTEVSDGDRLTVTNLTNGSRFSVRFLGIDAPEHDQPVGQMARDHLVLLALGQIVTISVTGFDGDGVVSSRIFLGERDLGEQMIRDGAAWVDKQVTALDAGTLRLYQDSERLAQHEHRGIWQEANPTPPWVHIRQKTEDALAEHARNEEIRKQQERAVTAARETERATQEIAKRASATTPINLPALAPGVTYISAGARVPAGSVTIGIGSAPQRPDEIVHAIKRAANGDIVCESSPIPRRFVVTAELFSTVCPPSLKLNNAMRIEEASVVQRDRVRKAIVALQRAILLFQINGDGKQFDVKVREAEPLVAQAIAVLPEGRLRANLERCGRALTDANIVSSARYGDYSARLSGDVLLALADKYELNNGGHLTASSIVDAARRFFNEAALEARTQDYIHLRGETEDQP